MQQKPSTRDTMQDYTEGQQEEMWVHKMKMWGCMKMEVLEAEKLNVLYEIINFYRRISEHRKELNLGLTGCWNEEGTILSEKDPPELDISVASWVLQKNWLMNMIQ
jgi:hypothetical protein